MRYIAQHIKSAGLAFGALAITGGTALAQDAVRAVLPDTTPCPDRSSSERAIAPSSARASAAAARVRSPGEPWLAVVVQVAAARKVQRLAATWALLRLGGTEMAPSTCAPALRPTAASNRSEVWGRNVVDLLSTGHMGLFTGPKKLAPSIERQGSH
jgi:hypothetical protein